MTEKIPPGGRKLLDGKNFAFVPTATKGDYPSVTPVWVSREGNMVVINTEAGRTKERNAVRDPRVAVAVIDMENPC